VLRLRSGDNLQYKDGYLLNEQSINIIALSASGKDKLKAWTDKGYEVTSAKVSYTLAWKPQDSDVEYAVCLANVILYKEQVKNNYSNYEDWNKRDIVFSKITK
jgi:ATP-dependent DNA helicase RecQ